MTGPSPHSRDGASNDPTRNHGTNDFLTDTTVPLSSTVSAPNNSSAIPEPFPPASAQSQNAGTADPSADASPRGSFEHDDARPATAKKTAREVLKSFPREFGSACWTIITSSPINLLLVFVPAGIATAQVHSLHGGVPFAMNAIAIVPLAGLLSFATESVAAQMGDAIGALMNVTFGNAVELIIFIIALTKGKIRIVQASLLGSILSNLLLILGMCFLFGGLRYREQIYNSTVTQMSACLLSLSVISLVLPTAFHASFSDERKADSNTLTISRATSLILLVVYCLYLLFQLKSHAYMYESTPQHIVDAQSTPGPAAGWLDSSSSSDGSSSSSDSDTSHNTVRKRVKKVLRSRRRRKDSTSTVETNDASPRRTRVPSGLNALGHPDITSEASSSGHITRVSPVPTNNSDDTDDEMGNRRLRRKRKHHNHYKKHDTHRKGDKDSEKEAAQVPDSHQADLEAGAPHRLDFADATPPGNPQETASRRAFPVLRGISVKNLAPPVFISDPPNAPSGPVPSIRYGIRRTNSLPDRLTRSHVNQSQTRRANGAILPTHNAPSSLPPDDSPGGNQPHHLSRPMAIVLLLLSTALVAVCAEFMVDSIEAVTQGNGVPEMFIGLIILPVVGNAAEHVTAITVAMKNKMDLAIGVAIGSSIQIALLVTPFIVILGWIINQPMTLYFTLFETVCLFVSAFIVNFLVLDGRSNYLEGALLCATYVIIAVVTYFSPDGDDAGPLGG